MVMINTNDVYHDWVPGRHPELDGLPPRGAPPHRRCTLLCRSCDFSLRTTGRERYALRMARGGPDLTSIDWRFVRAVRHEDSAVAPAASSPLSLQDGGWRRAVSMRLGWRRGHDV